MTLFLDSNVTIGYVFEGDKWHSQSKNVLKKQKNKYYSTNVLNETKRKINIIKDEIYDGLLSLSAELIRNKDIPYNLKLDNIIGIVRSNKSWKRLEYYINDIFYSNYNYEAPKEQFSQILKTYANNFLSIYIKRFGTLEKKLLLHNRVYHYLSLQLKLLEEVHDEDVLIILDAHDLHNKIGHVIFVTADSNQKKDEFVLNTTRIDEIKNLRDFMI